ncbi:hypothetical protein GWO43_02205 [candidate division KSB1 bacterium]|nr:hypothetical protein [candidate division KSB1 bacterium]NIT69722.1 hypothetical protein [candidate division KSB1 bacterium]NIX69403.1 hypothetical protein [candidate division KSB1 bacterium]
MSPKLGFVNLAFLPEHLTTLLFIQFTRGVNLLYNYNFNIIIILAYFPKDDAQSKIQYLSAAR